MALPLTADIGKLGGTHGDFWAWASNVNAIVNELQADHANFLAFMTATQGNYIIGVPALAGGSNADDVASALFHYFIGGKHYIKAAITTGTAPGNDVIPQGLYGAVAFEIGADGTMDAIEAADNATGYASAALAVAGIPAAAAAHARVGWVTATKSDGAFTFGTTNLNAANTTVAFTDAPTMFNAATAPAALTNTTALTLLKG